MNERIVYEKEVLNKREINKTKTGADEYKRILAIGDIHGMYDKLIGLMDQVQFNPIEDLLIFMGDYIDRGPEPLACLDYVMKLNLQYPDRVIPLLGNHEVMAINYFRSQDVSDEYDPEAIYIWLDNGGQDSYKQLAKLKKRECWKRICWMWMLSNHYKVGRYYFCHAGIQPFIPPEHQRESDLVWIREGFFELYDGRYGTIVIGHTPVQYLKMKHWKDGEAPVIPQFLENKVIMCDTGAYMDGGRLSCVDVLTGKYWQA